MSALLVGLILGLVVVASPPPPQVICSQPGLLDGFKIPADSLEVANDCWVMEPARIVHAVWWGGYLNWHPGDPHITTFDVRFYDNIECTPIDLIAEYIEVTPDTTFMGNCTDGLPCYRYDLDVEVDVGADPFWFTVKALIDSPDRYPPKWGRLGDELDIECFTVWGDLESGWEILDLPPDSDASQEFITEDPTPAENSTWGRIKVRFE